MPSTGLSGTYPLTSTGIHSSIKYKSPGAYALGYTKNGIFYISRIGRSDNDVAKRLTNYLGEYQEFKFKYYSTAYDAFLKECELYHKFSPPGNHIHPDKPNGVTVNCPYCSEYG